MLFWEGTNEQRVVRSGRMLGPVSLLASFALMGFSCQESKSAKGSAQTGRQATTARYGLADSDYERFAQAMDTPEAFFQRIGYAPLWTTTASEAVGRLPRGTSVIPPEMRVWEPWFRNSLKVNGTVLSTAELLKIRDYVAASIASDPRTEFRPPMTESQVAKSIEAVRLAALKELGVEKPSKTLVQLTQADAVWSFVKNRRVYGDEAENHFAPIEKRERRYATGDELLSQDYGLWCGHSTLHMFLLLRKLSSQTGTSISTAGVSVFLYGGNNYKVDPRWNGPYVHTHVGVALTTAEGRTAKFYYDPTPRRKRRQSSSTLAREFAEDFGPLDKIGIERIVATAVAPLLPNDRKSMNPSPRLITYDYLNGENGSVAYSSGNYDRTVKMYDADWDSRKRQAASFKEHFDQNREPIRRLEKEWVEVFRW